jgi:hypothetical protein
MAGAVMSDLHNAIMNLPEKVFFKGDKAFVDAYKIGFRDARHAAAELAAEHDAARMKVYIVMAAYREGETRTPTGVFSTRARANEIVAVIKGLAAHSTADFSVDEWEVDPK